VGPVQAALHFHEKQYGASRKILNFLFARIEVSRNAFEVRVLMPVRD
jgi:hypothetical protein